MSIPNRTIVVFAFVVISLSLCDGAEVVARKAQQPNERYPYTEQEVFFLNAKDHVRLAGTLSLPLSPDPVPAVVLCTGSGPQDRNEAMFGHKPFLVLADHLTRLGIAVLRVDDRGVGKSTGIFSEATSADFAADALAGLEYLKTRKEIAPGKIGLLGHCEGGLVASLAAAASREVAFLVMMGGPGLPGDQIVLGPGGDDLDGEWLSRELIAQMRGAQERIFTIIKNEKDHNLAQARVRKEAEVFRSIAARIRVEAAASHREAAETAAVAVEGQLPLLLSRWFQFYLTYDPRTALLKVKCPVLAVNGERDVQVPAKENLEAIREALSVGGNTDYTVLQLANLNHLFQTARTGAISEYDQIEETFSVLALDTVSSWILKHTQ
ncbi:MAG TPA: alpha/beta fold hydrolase [Pyrinomonadaceae bacterium]|nr:alpha/beta fold hydrolase [Pyrinomonadaceae bacterium]